MQCSSKATVSWLIFGLSVVRDNCCISKPMTGLLNWSLRFSGSALGKLLIKTLCQLACIVCTLVPSLRLRTIKPVSKSARTARSTRSASPVARHRPPTSQAISGLNCRSSHLRASRSTMHLTVSCAILPPAVRPSRRKEWHRISLSPGSPGRSPMGTLFISMNLSPGRRQSLALCRWTSTSWSDQWHKQPAISRRSGGNTTWVSSNVQGDARTGRARAQSALQRADPQKTYWRSAVGR